MSAEFPPSIEVNTGTTVSIYVDYSNLLEFEQDHPITPQSTPQAVADEYFVDATAQPMEYVGDGETREKAPSLGEFLYQISNPEPGTVGYTAKQIAQRYAIRQLVKETGALTGGAGAILGAMAALIKAGSEEAYGIGAALATSPEIALPAIAALSGYLIGNDIVQLNPDFWTEMLTEADPFGLYSPETNLFKKIFGVQYGDQTYLDGRLIDAIHNWLSERVPLSDYQYEYEGKTFDGYDVESGVAFDYPIEFSASAVRFVDDEPRDFDLRYSGLANITITSESPARYSVVRVARPSRVSGREEYVDGFVHYYLVISSESNTNVTVDGVSYINEHTDADIMRRSSTSKTVVLCSIRAIWSGSTGGWIPLSDAAPYVESLDGLQDSLSHAGETEKPEGVSEWPGTKITDYTQGAIEVVVDVNTGTTVPFYPVALPPNGIPYLDPTVYPDPTVVIQPNTQIKPYVVPIPIPTGIDVDVDPSLPGGDDDDNNLPDPSPGKDTGSTPSITVPTVVPPYDPSQSSNGGIFNVYNPSSSQLYSFCDWLWVKWTDANLNKIINNPFDGVISLHEIYATPATSGAKEITSGFLKSDVSAPLIQNRYTTIDCGSIAIPEYFNNYLDYSPYTKVLCYLPFIGVVELNSDDICGHAVNITYYVDSYSGACIATITVARSTYMGLDANDQPIYEDYESTMYQFCGNCAVQLPISGGSQAALTAGLWMSGSSAVGSVIGGIAGGLTGGGLADILNGISNGVSDVSATLLTRKSEVQHSGNMSGNFGAMAAKDPYIIVRRPRQKKVYGYNHDYGYPAHKRVLIGGCSGYLRVREINVISPTATNEEKAKIEQLLKEGVYMT